MVDTKTKAWPTDGLLSDSPIVHLFDDDDPTIGLCGAEITEVVGGDAEPECVVCVAIDEGRLASKPERHDAE